MNSFRINSKEYIDRNDKIIETQEILYNDKFKDVSISIKDEVFNTFFDNFKQIVLDATTKNKELAEKIIAPHYAHFKDIYYDVQFNSYCIHNIIDYFMKKKEIFVIELNNVDFSVCNKYTEVIINQEKEVILSKNKAHIDKINSLITNYDIWGKTLEFLTKHLDLMLKAGNYNEPHDTFLHYQKYYCV